MTYLMAVANNIGSPVAGSHDDGQFWGVYGIAGDSDFVYIIDSGNNRVQKFDSDGNFITKWGSLGQVRIYNSSGAQKILLLILLTMFMLQNQIITVSKNLTATVISSQSGVLMVLIMVNFRSPTGIAVDSSDNVYVADNFNNRVQKFDSDGNFITKWGSKCMQSLVVQIA